MSAANVSPADTQKFWDPAGEDVHMHSFDDDLRELEKKMQYYIDNPGYLSRMSFRLMALGLVGSVLLAVALFFWMSQTQDVDLRALGFFIIPFLPYLAFRGTVAATSKSLLAMIVAKKKQWAFRDEASNERIAALRKGYAEIFNRGHSHSIEAEWWGTQGKAVFWMANFTYVTGSGKNKQTHEKYVFATRLPRTLHTNFSLRPEGVSLGWIFGRKDAQVELQEFNRAFHITIGDGGIPGEQELRRVLSPVLQLQLLEAWKQDNSFSIVFMQNAAMIMVSEPAFKHLVTNFFRKVELDPKDEVTIAEGIQKKIQLIEKMLPYLD